MATVLRTPLFRTPPPRLTAISTNSPKHVCFSAFRHRCTKSSPLNSLQFSTKLRFLKFVPFASYEEATETDEVLQSKIEDSSDGVAGAEDDVEDDASDTDSTDAEEIAAEEITASPVMAALQSYKEALASNDESKIVEIEVFIKSIEDEKNDLERKAAIMFEELSIERDRILRISADFDNFRKRTERERLSLVTNAQGEVVENLLLVVDNFERAKAQIKVETEGEEKINNSYQSIYKQFIEILSSLGVVPVETLGKPFDPLLHEAIMREESTDFEEGIIIQEFRKGYKLGDRLLRPAMVKVSAGPGPAKPEPVAPMEEAEVVSETNEEAGTAEEASATARESA